MITSILTSVKKVLGIPADDESFDEDVLMFINTAFVTLTQLGLGPELGFTIVDDSATWDDFTEADKRLSSVPSYVFLRVKLLFDPPQTSYLIQALNDQRLEIEGRLSMYREDTAWQDPNTVLA